jgi:hypothetical protein
MIGIWMAWRKGEESAAIIAFMQSMRLALKKTPEMLAGRARP